MDIKIDIEKSKLIDGIWIIRNSIYNDKRGSIWSSFIKKDIEVLLPKDLQFNHDKFSVSKQNVLRGIHGDNKSWKLVTCVFGSIQQVVVDCRKDSKTYGNHESFLINKDNNISILIPPKLGNGYYVISKEALYHYKLAYEGSYFDFKQQFTIGWNDPKYSIDWFGKKPILSDRDNK